MGESLYIALVGMLLSVCGAGAVFLARSIAAHIRTTAFGNARRVALATHRKALPAPIPDDVLTVAPVRRVHESYNLNFFDDGDDETVMPTFANQTASAPSEPVDTPTDVITETPDWLNPRSAVFVHAEEFQKAVAVVNKAFNQAVSAAARLMDLPAEELEIDFASWPCRDNIRVKHIRREEGLPVSRTYTVWLDDLLPPEPKDDWDDVSAKTKGHTSSCDENHEEDQCIPDVSIDDLIEGLPETANQLFVQGTAPSVPLVVGTKAIARLGPEWQRLGSILKEASSGPPLLKAQLLKEQLRSLWAEGKIRLQEKASYNTNEASITRTIVTNISDAPIFIRGTKLDPKSAIPIDELCGSADPKDWNTITETIAELCSLGFVAVDFAPKDWSKVQRMTLLEQARQAHSIMTKMIGKRPKPKK